MWCDEEMRPGLSFCLFCLFLSFMSFFSGSGSEWVSDNVTYWAVHRLSSGQLKKSKFAQTFRHAANFLYCIESSWISFLFGLFTAHCCVICQILIYLTGFDAQHMYLQMYSIQGHKLFIWHLTDWRGLFNTHIIFRVNIFQLAYYQSSIDSFHQPSKMKLWLNLSVGLG